MIARPLGINDIIDAVVEASGVSVGEMRGGRRTVEIVNARRAVSILGRRHTRCSYPEIASAMLGNPQRHSSIIAQERGGIGAMGCGDVDLALVVARASEIVERRRHREVAERRAKRRKF